MWTTGLASHRLVVDIPGEPSTTALIVDDETGAPVVIDDDPDVYEQLIEMMRRAGARTVTFAEYRGKP